MSFGAFVKLVATLLSLPFVGVSHGVLNQQKLESFVVVVFFVVSSTRHLIWS